MKSNYSFDGRSRKPVEISMTPMIDVIFLLLVFFIATSSFQAVEKILPSGVSEMRQTSGDSNLPPPEITTQSLEQIIIKIASTPQGTVTSVNGQPLASFDDLKVRLQAIAQVNLNAPVIIDPEAKVVAKQVVIAYDWARATGLTNVFLATRKR
jgi:biopolymer transport protein ExbD